MVRRLSCSIPPHAQCASGARHCRVEPYWVDTPRSSAASYARRVGDGDVEALADVLGLAEEIDTAITEAVKGLRSHSYSWAEVGSRLGITRQAAQQRWAHLDPAAKLGGATADSHGLSRTTC